MTARCGKVNVGERDKLLYGLVLEYLQSGTQTENDTGFDRITGLGKQIERCPGRMIRRQLLEHDGQRFLGIVGQQLVDVGQILPLRREGFVQVGIEDQRFQQVCLTAIPEMIAFAVAGIANNDVGEDLSHHGISVQIGHAVPRVTVQGVNQVQHLDLVSAFPEQLGGIAVHL